MKQVKFKSTTNGRFKYLEGTTVEPDNFKIGLVVWFDNFHTSAIEKIEYKYNKNSTDLKVTTLNSTYVFTIEEAA